VPNVLGLLALAEDGLARVRKAPADPFVVLSTFVLVSSLRDWAKKERGIDPANLPWAQVVREVANGTKHLHLDLKSHPNLHLRGAVLAGEWDTLDWGDLHYDMDMISLEVVHAPGDRPHWRSALSILEEAIAGWQAVLR
jgi:hypothetical protein